jgi:hypothetical protein
MIAKINNEELLLPDPVPALLFPIYKIEKQQSHVVYQLIFIYRITILSDGLPLYPSYRKKKAIVPIAIK